MRKLQITTLVFAIALWGCPEEPELSVPDAGATSSGEDTDTGNGELDAGETSGGEDAGEDAGNGQLDAGDEGDTGEPEEPEDPWEPDTSGLTPAEEELYTALNNYRVNNGLDPVPLSYSLTVVARAHVQDLIDHGPQVLAGECNLHSWSDNGPWTGCCYTPDHAEKECMWIKPAELTNYTGSGFEISASGVSTGTGAVNLWAGSSGHNAVILNGTGWGTPWANVGVAIGGGYSHVWFGRVADPDDFPE